MSDYLLLGPVNFSGFEMPERIAFGGGQRMAVHVLPGGARVIDAMGRDDADIEWSGAFSGSDAADRARLLDLLRAEGGVWPLAWDAFCYLVVIGSFEAQYEHANWVPYRIACKVVQDQTQAIVAAVASLATGLLGDLAAMASVDTSAASAALAMAGATAPGSAAYVGAVGALGALSGQVSLGMASSGDALLAAGDPATAATAAGSLATLADARGYADRALANLTNAQG